MAAVSLSLANVRVHKELGRFAAVGREKVLLSDSLFCT